MDITERAAEAYLRYEYNRTFLHTGDVSVVGELRLDSVYTARCGFSYGRIDGGADVKAFASAAAAPFKRARGIDFTIAYIYNGLPAYETYAQAILPVVSYNARRFGAAAGPSFRFTSFFGEPAIFEYVAVFSLHVNIVNNEKWRVALSGGNLNEFYVGSKGVHSPRLIVEARLGSGWVVVNEIEHMISGSDGFSAAFYGFAWRGGVRCNI